MRTGQDALPTINNYVCYHLRVKLNLPVKPGLVFPFFGVVADKDAEGVIFAVADVDART